MIKPTLENLNDPYVLQLYERIAQQDDEIERQAKRIEELEATTVTTEYHDHIVNEKLAEIERLRGDLEIMRLQRDAKRWTDTRIDFEDDEFMWLAMYAHERDITLNQAINDILLWYVKRETNDD